VKQFCLYCCLLICISFWGCQSQSTSTVRQPVVESTVSQETMNNNTKPPQTVIDAVLNNITKETRNNIDTLQVQETDANTWSDGCLGLAKSDEFCTQALVEGWRIVVTDSQNTWVYRTDGTGKNIRRES
jgi:hypothetical protein